MNREEVIKYVKNKYHTKEVYLWEKYPLFSVFKHKDNKWFGVIMNIPKEKLGLDGKEEVDILNVKCLPDMIGSFRNEKGFYKAYHMNKEHWITILLDGSVDRNIIENLIDFSYDLTKK